MDPAVVCPDGAEAAPAIACGALIWRTQVI